MPLLHWSLLVQFVFLCSSTYVAAQDGRLTCPTVWTHTQPVTLTCEVSKTSITSKCVTTTDNTVFNVNSGEKCTVFPAGYASCLSSSPASPTINTCWCQQNSTYYTFVYYFTADQAQHNGSWTCEKTCRDGTGVLNPLQMTTSPGCVGVQVRDPPATTTTAPTTTTAQPPTSDGLTASQKAGIAVAFCFGVCGLLTVILTVVKCKGEELVGLDDEQIKRIDHYVQLLQANTSALRKIEKKRGFGCCDMPTKLRVDGFHSLNEAGELRDVQKQLRIAISIRLVFLCRRSMETVKQEVRDFLRENVTPYKVRIVKDPGNIDRQKLESIAAKTETKILPPAENRKGEMVIQIEGMDNRAVDDAKKEVMKLIQSSGSANGGDGP